MNVLSLFDGMSCGRIALDRTGVAVTNYYASEIDKYSILVSKHNYPDIIQIGDVSKVIYKDGILHTENGDFDVGKIDLLIGGSPCQSFSNAGNRTGFDGKSGLFYEFLRLKNEVSPDNFILENTRMKKKWVDIINNEMGVTAVEINSALFSAQVRKRLYWTNLNIGLISDRDICIADVVEGFTISKKISSSLQVNPCKKSCGKQPYYQDRVFHYSGKTHCLTTFGNGVWVGDYDEKTWLKLTPEHHELLQTVPVGYTNTVAKTHRYKMLGNGWTVDVIAHILNDLVGDRLLPTILKDSVL